jgi:cytochrome P450
VLSPVTLSTGVTLPKSSHLFLTTEGHYSPEFYPSPDKFIPDRFLQIRESGDVKASSKSHFVTTSPEHLGFGHGRNSCPGRFFASNELKIALVHLLLKYDWKYSPEGRLPDQTAGQSTWLPMDQKVMYRKRQVEPGLKF